MTREEHDALAGELQSRVASLEAVTRELTNVEQERERLRVLLRELQSQNEELRSKILDPPPRPVLDADGDSEFDDALAAVDAAAAAMSKLPDIAREALFQRHRSGAALTVGGMNDDFTVDQAKTFEEQGYVSWVEDESQQVTARRNNPRVSAADDALRRVREVAFEADYGASRAEAPLRIRPWLKDTYGIEDPTFELRPTWEKLGFLKIQSPRRQRFR